jgi:CxxC motif-containing protein
VKKEIELTCILCPRGCGITILEDGSSSGACCKRGESWVRQELDCPLRTVTTSIRVIDGREPLVSVRTDREIPLQHIKAIVHELHQLQVHAPVTIGETILENPISTECRIIATRTVEASVDS